MGIPIRLAISGFVDHIVNVVEHRPEEQMIESNARRVVAAVTNRKSSRDRSVREFKTNAMGKGSPPTIIPT